MDKLDADIWKDKIALTAVAIHLEEVERIEDKLNIGPRLKHTEKESSKNASRYVTDPRQCRVLRFLLLNLI